MYEFRTPWRAVSAMFAINGMLFGAWASRIPAVTEALGLEPQTLGLLLLLLAAGAILAFPFAGHTADKFGAANVTRLLALGNILCLLAISKSGSIAFLAVSLFAFGAAHGAMDVTMNSWAGEVEKHMKRPVMSSFHAMFSVGAGLGAATGYFAASWAWSLFTHFMAVGLLGGALAFYFASIRWVSPVHHATHDQPVFALPKGVLVLVGFVAFCSSIGEGAMADWSAVFLVRITEVSEATAALGYTAYSIGMVAMRAIGDRFVVRLGPVITARIGGIVAASGSACAILFATFEAALIGFILMGLGYALIVPLAFSRAANDTDMPSGRAIASVATLGYGGLLLGPPVIGFIAGAIGLKLALLVLTALALVIVALAQALIPPER